jgi:hypothetical protein
VGEHVRRVAPRIFEGVSQDRYSVEGAVGVNALRQGGDGLGPPRGIERGGSKGVANDAAEQVGLSALCSGMADRLSRVLTRRVEDPEK